jgi:hypothetical protein
MDQHGPPTYHDLFALEYGVGTLTQERRSFLQKVLGDMDDFGNLTVMTMKYSYDGTGMAGMSARIGN